MRWQDLSGVNQVFTGGCCDCFDSGFECVEDENCVVPDNTTLGECKQDQHCISEGMKEVPLHQIWRIAAKGPQSDPRFTPSIRMLSEMCTNTPM